MLKCQAKSKCESTRQFRWVLFLYEQRGNPKKERVIFLSGFTYKEQYAVVVMCKDEKEQENIYNRLKEEGFKLKVVAV